ncbi:hypothetical protein D9B84_08710 [Serratia marcescens]|nr:hypothetical protein D9B84_08710 [Serratia marcescens]
MVPVNSVHKKARIRCGLRKSALSDDSYARLHRPQEGGTPPTVKSNIFVHLPTLSVNAHLTRPLP